MDLIVIMTIIYILIIFEGMVSKICYFCPFDRNNVWFEHEYVISDFVVSRTVFKEVNTHFDYSARLCSSRWKRQMHLFFLNEVLWKLRPISDTHHPHESQISRVALFFAASFFFLYFPILFFSAKLTLTENSSSPLFWPFPPFSEVVSHDVECFYRCNVAENGRSVWTEHLGVKRWRSK